MDTQSQATFHAARAATHKRNHSYSKYLSTHTHTHTRYMDAQSQAMIDAARAAIRKRNHTYSKYLSDLFDEASRRAQLFADVR